MKYADFQDWVEKNCVYETFYKDSEGRIILVITELDAWAMCNKFTKEQHEWVGLTEEERQHIWRNLENGGGPKSFC